MLISYTSYLFSNELSLEQVKLIVRDSECCRK